MQREQCTFRPVKQSSGHPIVLHQKIPLPIRGGHSTQRKLNRAALKFVPQFVLLDIPRFFSIEAWREAFSCIALPTEPQRQIFIGLTPFLSKLPNGVDKL